MKICYVFQSIVMVDFGCQLDWSKRCPGVSETKLHMSMTDSRDDWTMRTLRCS